MKYRYGFATGTETVEIPEEWASVLEEMDHEEQLSDRRERRRHQSLDDLLYEGMEFAADGDAESPLMEQEFSRELAAALAVPQFKLSGPVNCTDLDAEEVSSAALHLLFVFPAETLCEIGIVRCQDNIFSWVFPQIPARERFAHRHALAVLRRALDDQNVIGVAGIRLDKRLDLPG